MDNFITKFTGKGKSYKIQFPTKKEFNVMYELLKDAEKYDNSNEIEIRDSILDNLTLYISKLKENEIKKKLKYLIL